jgi:ASC-1-like (ASCH) protein
MKRGSTLPQEVGKVKRARPEGFDALADDLPLTVSERIRRKMAKKSEAFFKKLLESMNALFDTKEDSDELLSEAPFPWSDKTVKPVITQKMYIKPISEGRKTLEVRFENKTSCSIKVGEILKLYNGILYPSHEDFDYCFAEVTKITPYDSIDDMLTAFQESDQIKDALPDMPTLENAKTIYGKKIKAGNNKKILVFTLSRMEQSEVLAYADHDACYNAVRANDQVHRFSLFARLHGKHLSLAKTIINNPTESSGVKDQVDRLVKRGAQSLSDAKCVSDLYQEKKIEEAKEKVKSVLSSAEDIVDQSRGLKKQVDAFATKMASEVVKLLAEKPSLAPIRVWMEETRDKLRKGEALSPQKKSGRNKLEYIFKTRTKLLLSMMAVLSEVTLLDQEAKHSVTTSSSLSADHQPNASGSGGGLLCSCPSSVIDSQSELRY